MKEHKNIHFNCNEVLIENQKLQHIASDEKGFILVVSLVLLLVVTVMGVLALSTSTTEVMIAGNQRIKEMNQISADGGKDIVVPIIEDCVYYDQVDREKFPNIKDTNFHNELQINDSDVDGTGNLPSSNHDSSANALNNADIEFEFPTIDPLSSGTETTQGVTVYIDVDYLFSAYAAGSAIEFGSGYEGAGKGMASGGGLVYYKINSFGKGKTGAESEVGTIYRYAFK